MIGVILMILGLAIVVIAVIVGLWMIHPILGIIMLGATIIAIGKTILDDQ